MLESTTNPIGKLCCFSAWLDDPACTHHSCCWAFQSPWILLSRSQTSFCVSENLFTGARSSESERVYTLSHKTRISTAWLCIYLYEQFGLLIGDENLDDTRMVLDYEESY